MMMAQLMIMLLNVDSNARCFARHSFPTINPCVEQMCYTRLIMHCGCALRRTAQL
jgi:hypothetical protein